MRGRDFATVVITLGVLALGAVSVCAQSPESQGQTAAPETKTVVAPIEPKSDDNSGLEPTTSTSIRSPKKLGERFLLDQKEIWTSPTKLRWPDVNWLFPLSGITAGMFVTDADMSRHISHNPTTVSHYNTISNAGIAAMLAAPAAMWMLSYPKHNEKWRETGFLAGEAVLNSLVVTEAMKYPLGRQRPYQGNGDGNFFSGGVSFPSEHATAAFAVAGVVAHEYPGPLTKILAYSLATLVDYSRYRARQHFPSDVFVGSIIGNMVAESVYNRHHDLELGGEPWNSFRSYLRQTQATSSANMGSPYVPLDSWIYPAMDRLIAQGYIKSAIVDMRPWTRFECARLVNEAAEQLDGVDAGSSQPAKIYRVLDEEFREDRLLMEGGDNTRAQLESAYTKITGISGQPLSQGYHYDFGQTIINDFGRPYEEGFNNVTGFSGWATESRFVVYASGEFQHAPSAPPLTASARQVISQVQVVPEPPGTPISSINRFQWLDSYVGMTFSNWQFTFGKQSLWWGPAASPMMFSDNAEPVTMFRVNRVSPFKLPSVFGLLGPMRIELFLGQLSGQNFVYGQTTGLVGSWTNPFSPQPMISGERFSFKPTPNVEFGFALTTLFAGAGVPFTFHTYFKSIFSAGNTVNPYDVGAPGDRRSGFELSYRLPLLRNWATFYADGFADDQFTPVAYWDRSAWTSGLYFSHLPKLQKLDLRLEGSYSDVPAGGKICCGFFYWNARYLSGYTNDGNLMGSWIGRDGQGALAQTNYWFTAKHRIQFNFRHQKVSQQFIPGGGSLTDAGGRVDFSLGRGMLIGASVQYGRWLFPAIQPGAEKGITTSVEINFQPHKIFHSSVHSASLEVTGTESLN